MRRQQHTILQVNTATIPINQLNRHENYTAEKARNSLINLVRLALFSSCNHHTIASRINKRIKIRIIKNQSIMRYDRFC